MRRPRLTSPTLTERKARERLERRTDAEILDWCDQAGTGMARMLSDFRHDPAPELLREAALGAMCLAVAVDILQDRHS